MQLPFSLPGPDIDLCTVSTCMQLPFSLPGPSVALVGPRPNQARAWLRHWREDEGRNSEGREKGGK